MQHKTSKSIGREIFASTALILLSSLLLMGGVLCALSMAYFTQERHSSLTSVLDAATALGDRFAARGQDITRPIDDEALRRNIEEGFELFHTSSDVAVFVADGAGQVMLRTDNDVLTGAPVPAGILARMDGGEDYFERGTLGDVLGGKYYVAGRQMQGGQARAYLFVCTSTQSMYQYLADSISVICLSALCILLLALIVSLLLTRKITAPIEQISAAARQLGGGDFTARAPVDGCEELAGFATTFNNMAARLQTIDNARGQFMGNIAHELRTPMTSIKGFIDGMLDDTIPESEYKHYLTIVSQETGRLARLVAEHAGHHKARKRRVQGAGPHLQRVGHADRRCAVGRTAHRERPHRHPGPGAGTRVRLRRPRPCASGRVQHCGQCDQVHAAGRGHQIPGHPQRRHGVCLGPKTPARALRPRRCPLCSSAFIRRTAPAG